MSKCLQKVGEPSNEEDGAAESCILHTKTILTENGSVPETFDVQVKGDVSSGWKMVLHEESNQYYYWNTLTGETSWEVPVVLAREMASTFASNGVAEAEGAENDVVGMNNSNSALNVKLEDAVATQPSRGSDVSDLNCKNEEVLDIRPGIEVLNEVYTSELPDSRKGCHDVDQQKNMGTDSALHRETSEPGELVGTSNLDNALLSNQSSEDADSHEYPLHLRDQDEHESSGDLCSRLVRLGEYLLERLQTLKGYAFAFSSFLACPHC